MKNKKVLYVYTGNHPVHRKFAETITQDHLSIKKKIPKGYDVYFFEGEYGKPVFWKKFGILPRKSKIVTLFADPRLFYLKTNRKFDYSSKKIKKRGILKNIISKKLLNKIDGALCAGKFQEELFRNFNNKSPLKKVYPFIKEERYNQLAKINPNLNNHNILFIGNGPDYYVKGLDMLIDSFCEVKKIFPDAKLYILGENWEREKFRIKEGVFFEDKKDILNYLKKVSLSLHLGRGEGFGINVLETMRAGIPTIVSEYTGSKEFVKKAYKPFVASFKKEIIFELIKEYFEMKSEDKKNLSAKMREAVKGCNENKRLKQFKKEFLSLMDEIQNE